MSEEEILNYVAGSIDDYLMLIRSGHGQFVLKDCMSRQIHKLRELYRESRILRRNDTLSSREILELEQIINHFSPLMHKRAKAAQMKYTKEQTIWMIRGTAADALIRKALSGVGLNAEVQCQKYRAKVIIDLGGRKLQFYVGFKKLEKEGALQEITSSVLDLLDAANRIGGDIKIGR